MHESYPFAIGQDDENYEWRSKILAALDFYGDDPEMRGMNDLLLNLMPEPGNSPITFRDAATIGGFTAYNEAATEAQARYLEERDNGYHNDLRSVAPGFIALLEIDAPDLHETIEPTIDHTALNDPSLRPTIRHAGHNQDGTRKFYVLNCPKGVYEVPGLSMKMDVIQFHTEATIETYGEVDEQTRILTKVDHRMKLPTTKIHRIHASYGRLWQNPNLMLPPDLIVKD